MSNRWPMVPFGKFLIPNKRPYELGPDEDANLVGMKWYGLGPFHREFKPAIQIRKKSHFVIRTGDVIYNKLFAWKGAFGVVRAELDGMFVSDKFPSYAVDDDLADRDYLRWYFRSPPLWEQAKERSTGSAAISKLTLNPPQFLELLAPLPPLPEQQRIVARIEDLAAKIGEARFLNNRSAVDSEGLSRSAIGSAFERVSVNGTFGRVLRRKPRNGRSSHCDNSEDGTAILSLGAITGFHYRSSEFKRTSCQTTPDAHYWLKEGDMLIGRSNTPELVGHVAIYDGQPSPCIYPDLMMRLDVAGELVDKRFVWYWLQTPRVRDFIKSNAKGTSPTMKKIAQGTVMSIPFPGAISLSDQRRIVAYLDDLQGKVEGLKQLQAKTAAELDALLPSILDKAFRGEL